MDSNDTADIALVERTSIDEGEAQMELLARMAANLLTRHYPLHLWAIGWAPGGTLVLKNMAMDGRYGYTVDVPQAATVSELEHAIVMGGGELLERMGMVRGKWNGEFASQVDGVTKPRILQ